MLPRTVVAPDRPDLRTVDLRHILDSDRFQQPGMLYRARLGAAGQDPASSTTSKTS